jgi:hypothetical protein
MIKVKNHSSISFITNTKLKETKYLPINIQLCSKKGIYFKIFDIRTKFYIHFISYI